MNDRIGPAAVADLLRSGALTDAPEQAWLDVRPVLSDLCRRSPELMELLVATAPARPDGRQAWLRVLADSGAGADLPVEWFTSLGPVPGTALAPLATQAGTRLFPARPGHDPAADPVVFTEPHDRPRFPDDLDDLVLALGRDVDTDRLARLRELVRDGATRTALDRLVEACLAEYAAGDLQGVERAVSSLLPLVESGYATLAPERFAAVTITDPVDAAHRLLRSGLRHELAPITPPVPANMGVSLVQHGDRLFVGADRVYEFSPSGEIVTHDGRAHISGLLWVDGGTVLASRYHDGVCQTYRVHPDGMLTVDAETAGRWPDSDPVAEVRFPGADRAVTVRHDRGRLEVRDADGRLTDRMPFAPTQLAPYVLPPGWWKHQRPVDPAGSAVLRTLDRDAVADLVGAAAAGPATLRARLEDHVVAINDPTLAGAVVDVLTRAADALVRTTRLRAALGIDAPAWQPPILRTTPGLRAGAATETLVAVRALSDVVRAAAQDGAPELRPLGVAELPSGMQAISTGGYLGRLGGAALDAAWPWTPESDRRRLLRALAAWGDTPWCDGTDRYRTLTYAPYRRLHTVGEVWRTPNGALLIIRYNEDSAGTIAVEYSPDGTFVPFDDLPGMTLKDTSKTPGWGGADRVRRFLDLLATRGPAPSHTDDVRTLADRLRLPLDQVAGAVYGHSPWVTDRMPPDVRDMVGTARSRQLYWLHRTVQPQVMPAEPADLWDAPLEIDRIAAWFEGHRSEYDSYRAGPSGHPARTSRP